MTTEMTTDPKSSVLEGEINKYDFVTQTQGVFRARKVWTQRSSLRYPR